jgi:MFS family permease|tara:strand:+ start:191 stop:1420 length:1230 start_codon:yes stop_codon:yes gene_type:complete
LETAEAAPQTKTDIRNRAWFMISGLAAGHAVFHWLIQSSVVVLPEIQSTFQLSGIGVGVVLTVREVVSGIVVLPGGIVVDLLRRHWGVFLAACIGGFSLGTLLMSLSPVFLLLLAGMAMVAISHSLWHLPASASLSAHFPENRGTALSFHGVGGSVGDVLGPIVTGALLAVMSWRGILGIYGALPLFLAFMALWSFKNIGGTAATPDLRDRIAVTKRLLRNRSLWTITLVKGLRGMALAALVTILPLYLANDLDLSSQSRGIHIGLLIAIGIVAKPVAGQLSDRLGRKRVLVPGLVWSCGVTLSLLVADQGIALTVAIVLLGLFLYPDQPITTAATLEMVDRNVASTALGLTASAGFFLSSFSPIIAGALYESNGIDAVLYYVATLFALAAIIFAILPLGSRGTSDEGR